MPIETVVWIISGCLGLLSILSGVIWKMLRDESKEQSLKIERKADKDRVAEHGRVFEKQLSEIKADAIRREERLESRYEKTIDSMEKRILTEVSQVREDLGRQMTIILELLQKK